MSERSTRRNNETKPPTKEEKLQSLYDFWKFIDIIQFHGGSSSFGQCHRDMVQWMEDTYEEYDNTLMLVPRGHLKSTLMTVARALWRIYQIPDIRLFVGTATRSLATAFVREIRSYLEDPWLMENVWNSRPHYEGNLIPDMERTKYRRDNNDAKDKKVIWSSSAIQVIRPTILKEPTVTVGSVGTIPTGFHFDEMYLDDVVNYDNINTPDKRERLITWVDDLVCVLDPKYTEEQYLTRLPIQAKKYATLGGRFNVVGTRYDINDWYGDIIDNHQGTSWAVYQRNIYKNGQDSTEGYLWHEVWTEDLERIKRSQMTAQRFASQYLNAIMAPGSSILDIDKIIKVQVWQIEQQEDGYVKVQNENLPGGFSTIRPILVLDTATTVGEESDFTAMVVGGKDTHGNVFCLDGKMGKWTGEEILKNMYGLIDKWKLRAAHIESVGGFAHFLAFVRASFSRYKPIVLYEYKPVYTQGKKEVRIANSLEPLIANSMFYMNTTILGDSNIRDQLMFFPRKTMHDDFPDVLAALSELAKGGKLKAVNNLAPYKNKIYGGFR